MFHEFAWGGYLVFAWPEQRIFIDGGTDFFGEDLFKEYSRVKQRQPGWRDVLKRWDISLALLQRKWASRTNWSRPALGAVVLRLARGPVSPRPRSRAVRARAGRLRRARARRVRPGSTASGDPDQGHAPGEPTRLRARASTASTPVRARFNGSGTSRMSDRTLARPNCLGSRATTAIGKRIVFQ